MRAGCRVPTGVVQELRGKTAIPRLRPSLGCEGERRSGNQKPEVAGLCGAGCSWEAVTFCAEVLRPKAALQGGSLGKNTFSLLCPAKALIGQTPQEAEGIGAWAGLHAGHPPGARAG